MSATDKKGNKTTQLSAKPKASHPWRQYGSGWLKKDTEQKFTSSLIGGTHYQHGKRPC